MISNSAPGISPAISRRVFWNSPSYGQTLTFNAQPMTRKLAIILIVGLSAFAGCSGGPERFEAPSVATEDAAAKAMEFYDANADGALSAEELKQCPAILERISSYDKSGNGSVEKEEIAAHLKNLLNGTGGTQLTAFVTLKGHPLSGATVMLEPEPYLGDEVQAARGETDGSGSAQLAIPAEFVPEHLRRFSAVHYGTFKVRITHPSMPIPAKYNTETQLGYETEIGKPSVRFELK